jgi:hypothetical protein
MRQQCENFGKGAKRTVIWWTMHECAQNKREIYVMSTCPVTKETLTVPLSCGLDKKKIGVVEGRFIIYVEVVCVLLNQICVLYVEKSFSYLD